LPSGSERNEKFELVTTEVTGISYFPGFREKLTWQRWKIFISLTPHPLK